MTGDGSGRSTRTRLLLLVLSVSLNLITDLIGDQIYLILVWAEFDSVIIATIGLSENPSSPKDSTTTTSNHSSSSKTGLELFLACLGVAIIILLSFFLFKMWQKRRREEQYARLLKLFEEDNELEVELGLRD
ncbi:hypothetical protein ZIOFF_063427 [Zingiber officinale]|uniref:Transmembrane protein n=1 Tax=Zingiber officinale TaxID=94328 RepID=A0A8J5K9R8_ZINOF|nr:hypothetical protein ZIOFF_063427 [Zingiber officinale]